MAKVCAKRCGETALSMKRVITAWWCGSTVLTPMEMSSPSRPVHPTRPVQQRAIPSSFIQQWFLAWSTCCWTATRSQPSLQLITRLLNYNFASYFLTLQFWSIPFSSSLYSSLYSYNKVIYSTTYGEHTEVHFEWIPLGSAPTPTGSSDPRKGTGKFQCC